MSLFRAAQNRVLNARARRATPRRRSAATATGLVGAVLAVDVLTGAGAASAASTEDLRRLAQCESGGNYSTNTGNGYYGAYQFSLATWKSLGYGGYPHHASPAVQDEAASRLQARSGWGQWPACSRKLGLRSGRGATDAPAPRPFNAIDAHYAANGEVRNGLGAPLGPEFPVRGGAARNYQRGHMVWSPATGAHAVYGEIFKAYGRLGWEQGLLGFPVSDERPGPDGSRVNNFQFGKIVWTPAGGAKAVFGDIVVRYNALGGANGSLGVPVTGEVRVRGGIKQDFARGAIYWDHDDRATTALTGPVLAAYRAAGGASELGMPVAVEDGGARVRFEDGVIAYDAAARDATVVG